MPPNVLVIQTDDHGQWAAGCYGNSELRTPSLDYLASTGVRFANAFTPTPVCSPARASFWTGRLASQHGIHDYLAEAAPDVRARDWLGGERTLAQIFHDAGYVTGLSGKWHLGHEDERQPGFDYWYQLGFPIARPTAFETPWARPAETETLEPNPHAATDHAVDFLRRRDPARPFFLYVGYFATHSPWLGHPERLVRQYRQCSFRDVPEEPVHPYGRLSVECVQPSRLDRREALAQYYASVSEIDEQVGRLLDELATQELVGETLVVYTADHGLNASHHGLWGKGNATQPYNMLEESIRVPLILSHPGVLLGGQVRAEMVNHCDLFQTILEHAGLDPSSDERARRRYPGRSFRDRCRGDARRPWPAELFGEYGNLRMVRTARHKLVRRYPDGPNELFDLERDPRETRSLFDDPAYAAVVADLTTRLEEYFARYEDGAASGLRVLERPRHNLDEAWRWSGEHAISGRSDYIILAREALRARIAAERGESPSSAADR
jgi:choline-sulfatase